jgi:hypothetical protein
MDSTGGLASPATVIRFLKKPNRYSLLMFRKKRDDLTESKTGKIIPLILSITIPKSEIRNQFSSTNSPFLNSPLTFLPSG